MTLIQAWILITTLGTFTIDDVPRAEGMFTNKTGCVLGAQVYIKADPTVMRTARCWNYITNESVVVRHTQTRINNRAAFTIDRKRRSLPPLPTRNPKR